MKNELGTDKITYDTETGQRYTYLGGGMSLDSLKPDSVLAYSPIVNGHCEVLFADGSVEQMTAGRFAELSQRGLVQLATPQEIAVQQQRQAIGRGQFVSQPAAATRRAVGEVVRQPLSATSGGGGGGGGPTALARSRQAVFPAATPPPVRPPLPASARSASNCRRPASRSCSRKCSMSATSRFPSGPASCRCTRSRPFKWSGRRRRFCSASSSGGGNGGGWTAAVSSSPSRWH